jgi:hypothetical protein
MGVPVFYFQNLVTLIVNYIIILTITQIAFFKLKNRLLHLTSYIQ